MAKLYEINEDWFLANNPEDAKREAMSECSLCEEDVEDCREVPDNELEKLIYYHDHETEDAKTETFKERIAFHVKNKTQLPYYFAVNLSNM